MRPGRSLLAACLLALASPAAAQDAGLPEPVQGLWVAGECTSPDAMLFATARGWAALPTGGQQRMWRVARTGTTGDFVLAVADDEDQTRLLLRASPAGLETRIREWAAEEGRVVGLEAAEALRVVVIDEDEDESPHVHHGEGDDEAT